MAHFLRQFFQNIWYWLCNYLNLFTTLFQGGVNNNNSNTNNLRLQNQNNLSRTDYLIGDHHYNLSVKKPGRIFQVIGANNIKVLEVTVPTEDDLIRVTDDKVLVPSTTTTTTTEGNSVKELIPKIKDASSTASTFAVTSTTTSTLSSTGPSLLVTTDIPSPSPDYFSTKENSDESNLEFPIDKTKDSREDPHHGSSSNSSSSGENLTWLDIDERMFIGDETTTEKVAPSYDGLTSFDQDNVMNSVEGDTVAAAAPLPKLQDKASVLDLLRPPTLNFTDRQRSSLLSKEKEAEQNLVQLFNDDDHESKVDSTSIMGLKKTTGEDDNNVYELAGRYLPPSMQYLPPKLSS